MKTKPSEINWYIACVDMGENPDDRNQMSREEREEITKHRDALRNGAPFIQLGSAEETRDGQDVYDLVEQANESLFNFGFTMCKTGGPSPHEVITCLEDIVQRLNSALRKNSKGAIVFETYTGDERGREPQTEDPFLEDFKKKCIFAHDEYFNLSFPTDATYSLLADALLLLGNDVDFLRDDYEFNNAQGSPVADFFNPIDGGDYDIRYDGIGIYNSDLREYLTSDTARFANVEEYMQDSHTFEILTCARAVMLEELAHMETEIFHWVYKKLMEAL